MKKSPIPILGLLTGKVAPLGAKAAPSGIAKNPVTGPLYLGPTGFEGDGQGDTVRHGGPEKAAHHYPFDHYGFWRTTLDAPDLLHKPGAFGENLSTSGLTEADIAVGDVFRLGTATVEVSQGRQPCWKLNERFNDPAAARTVQATGRTGWYYRVIEPGMVSPDDALRLIDRRSPDWTIQRIWHHFYVDRLNGDALSAIAALPALADSWRQYAVKRLETGKVEDWSKRLVGTT